MFKSKILLVTLFLSVILSLSLYSETSEKNDDQDSEVIHEKIEVLGRISAERAPQSVTVFKKKDFALQKYTNFKSMIAKTPGILSLSTGMYGQAGSTFIRGSKSGQVLYIVDGIKIRDNANLGGVNLYALSPESIRRVEIVRGPLSSRYGSDAMGGVISVETDSNGFSASFGSHGSYNGSLGKSFSNELFDAGFNVNFQKFSENIDNDELKNFGLSAKADYKFSEFSKIGLRLFGNFSDSGIPFSAPSVQSLNREFKSKVFVAAIPFTYKLNEASSLRAQLSYNKNIYEFEDPDDMYNSYFKGDSEVIEAEASYTNYLTEGISLTAGIDYNSETILNKDNNSVQIDNKKTHHFSAYVSSDLNFDNLTLVVAGRFDKYKDVDSNFSPQIGVSYLINNSFKLKASYAKSFKAPKLTQQINFWGNPNFNLKPEICNSFEAGFEYYSGIFMFEAVYFKSDYKDMIDWVTDPVTWAGQYQNISEIDIYGIELSATVKPVSSLSLTGSYTYLHTEDPATGKPLKRRAKHTFSISALYSNKYFSLAATGIYVGKRDDIKYVGWSSMDVICPSYNTYSVTLTVPVMEQLSVFGKLTNAFDKDYEEIYGYPTAGRRFEFGINYKL